MRENLKERLLRSVSLPADSQAMMTLVAQFEKRVEACSGEKLCAEKVLEKYVGLASHIQRTLPVVTGRKSTFEPPAPLKPHHHKPPEGQDGISRKDSVAARFLNQEIPCFFPECEDLRAQLAEAISAAGGLDNCAPCVRDRLESQYAFRAEQAYGKSPE